MTFTLWLLNVTSATFKGQLYVTSKSNALNCWTCLTVIIPSSHKTIFYLSKIYTYIDSINIFFYIFQIQGKNSESHSFNFVYSLPAYAIIAVIDYPLTLYIDRQSHLIYLASPSSIITHPLYMQTISPHLSGQPFFGLYPTPYTDRPSHLIYLASPSSGYNPSFILTDHFTIFIWPALLL